MIITISSHQLDRAPMRVWVVTSEKFYGGDNMHAFMTREAAEAWASPYYKTANLDHQIVELDVQGSSWSWRWRQEKGEAAAAGYDAFGEPLREALESRLFKLQNTGKTAVIDVQLMEES